MHDVVVLALDQVVAFDLGVPTQIFHGARDADDNRLYEVSVASLDGGPVRTSAGFDVQPAHGPGAIARADTLVIAGISVDSAHMRREVHPDVAAALALRRPDARVMSICTGAFVLAGAGLLDGRPATTHWWYADRFRRWFPSVRLDPDVLFIDDGDVLTSAGVAAGIDLCLHVVRRDHGADVANGSARRGVVSPFRDGGQSQFIERHVPARTDSSTAPTRAWVAERLHEDIALVDMAAHARMSVRTFTRRFRADTGLSPGRWLIGQRVEHARRLLEATDLPIDRVAVAAGFGTATSMRQHLHAELGVAPATYRRTFRRP